MTETMSCVRISTKIKMAKLNEQLDEYIEAITKLTEMRTVQLSENIEQLREEYKLNKRLKAEL